MLMYPSQSRAVVVGGGTMGNDVAAVLARASCPTILVESSAARRESLPGTLAAALDTHAAQAHLVSVVADLDDIDWSGIDLVIECIPERVDIKQALFARLERLARPDCILTSNSSSFPISAIADGLSTGSRMLGLHFFMPAHLVPLVEVVMGGASDLAHAQALSDFMRRCAMVPVLVKKDLPGFLANRLQHALSREAFDMIDQGIASPEDVDAAVRFGFGFRFLAAGPVMQRDHAGIEVHCAAGATMYPTLNNSPLPAKALSDRVAAGHLGMKTGQGFYTWTPETIAAERKRYDDLLKAGLTLLAKELPPLKPGPDHD